MTRPQPILAIGLQSNEFKTPGLPQFTSSPACPGKKMPAEDLVGRKKLIGSKATEKL